MRVDAALVLAGGRGEKTWPLTATRAKPLLPLPGGDSILSRLVRQSLRVARRVYVLAPPGGGEAFRVELERRGLLGGRVEVIEQGRYEETGYGSGAAARFLLEKIGSADDVLVVHGDLVLHDSVFDALLGSRGYALVAFRTRRDGRRYGVVVEEGGVLKRVVEKPGWSGEVLANSAVYLLPGRELLEALEGVGVSPRGEVELPDAVNKLAERLEIRVVVIPESWRKGVGPWWDYLEASRMVLGWLAEGGSCRRVEGFEGNALVCGEGFEVEPPVYASGVVWLSRGARVGPFTRLRGPVVIHEGVELGSFVEVKGSVLLEGVKAHHLAYIGDSVVGEHTNIAAGTVTANLRHDGATVKSCAGGRVVDTGLRKLGAAIGAYVKTGVNSSIAPGARIGPCVWLEEGAVARRDIPSCSIVRRDGRVEPNERVAECCERLRLRDTGLCTPSS